MQKLVIRKLEERGVSLEKVAEIVFELQSAYFADLTLEACYDAVLVVLKKREVQYAIITGLAWISLLNKDYCPTPFGNHPKGRALVRN